MANCVGKICAHTLKVLLDFCLVVWNADKFIEKGKLNQIYRYNYNALFSAYMTFSAKEYLVALCIIDSLKKLAPSLHAILRFGQSKFILTLWKIATGDQIVADYRGQCGSVLCWDFGLLESETTVSSERDWYSLSTEYLNKPLCVLITIYFGFSSKVSCWYA